MKNKIILFLLIILSLSFINIYAQNEEIIKETTTLNVNNNNISIPSYKISNEHYYMLRDIAYILNGSNKQINITWDKDKNAAKIVQNTEYVKIGNELNNIDIKESIKVIPSLSEVNYEDKKLDITAYEINGSNYFRLEDLMLLFDISLLHDENNKVIGIDTSKPYDLTKHIFSPQKNVFILLYHDLTNEKTLSPDKYSFVVTSEKFENDIKVLLAEGYQPLSLQDYYLNKYNKNKKYFILTFDDGYLSNYEIAYPIIKKYNIYADIFINTDNIYMDHHFKLNQAKEMEDSGLVKIYSHYPTHVDVREIDDAEYTKMLAKSIQTLEEVLDKKDFYFFAYPYSFYDENKYKLTKNASYKLQAVQSITYKENDVILRHNITHTTDILKLISNIVH